MKKAAEIMEELGFRPEGSDEVKKAFIKNLIREAEASRFKAKNQKPSKKPQKKQISEEQLSFFGRKSS